MTSRWTALLPVTLAGCATPAALAILAGGVVAPPAIGLTATPTRAATSEATLTGGGVRGDADHEGGWGVDLQTSSAVNGYFAHGHAELGQFGRDRVYGYTGAELGVGVKHDALAAGLMIGYGYGGYPQNGHQVPVRAIALVPVWRVNLRLSGYAGWRFGIADEYPAAASRFGPGWNTYGGDVGVLLDVVEHREGHQGVGVGLVGSIGVDRQDDVSAVWLKLGVGGVLFERGPSPF